jgi:hypothetical protein
MLSEDELRQELLRLISRYGISQKVLAAHMGLSETWLSRWLGKEPTRPISLRAVSGFEQYLRELYSAIARQLYQVAPTREEPPPMPKDPPASTTGGFSKAATPRQGDHPPTRARLAEPESRVSTPRLKQQRARRR